MGNLLDFVWSVEGVVQVRVIEAGAGVQLASN